MAEHARCWRRGKARKRGECAPRPEWLVDASAGADRQPGQGAVTDRCLGGMSASRRREGESRPAVTTRGLQSATAGGEDRESVRRPCGGSGGGGTPAMAQRQGAAGQRDRPMACGQENAVSRARNGNQSEQEWRWETGGFMARRRGLLAVMHGLCQAGLGGSGRPSILPVDKYVQFFYCRHPYTPQFLLLADSARLPA